MLLTEMDRTASRLLARRLIEHGRSVRALCFRELADPDLPEAGFERIRLDAEDGRGIDAAMAGVSELFLSALGVEQSAELQARIIESARAAGIRRVVHVTRLGDARGRSPELMRLVDAGVDVIELRTAMTMQMLYRLAPQIETGVLHAPLSNMPVALIDARDVAEVAATCFTERERVEGAIELTGPESLTMSEVAARLSEYLGEPIEYVPGTPLSAWQAWLAAGIGEDDARELALAFRLATATSGRAPSPGVEHLLGRPARSLAELLEDDPDAFGVATRRRRRWHRQHALER